MKDILFNLETVANEKDLPAHEVRAALEAAFAAAVRKAHNDEIEVRVSLGSGDVANPLGFQAYRVWQVVDKALISDEDEPFNEATMVDIHEAKREDDTIEVGATMEAPIEASLDMGRIGAQIVKQTFRQQLRDAGRRQVLERYERRVGEIFYASIRRVDRGNVIVDLEDNVEAIMRTGQQIPGEHYRVGSRVRVYLYEVNPNVRGVQLFVSRALPRFVEELFAVEVPEIAEGIVEIKGVARDVGQRAKMAVHTGDPNLDPVGTCVGMRGSRVTAVTDELNGERIDIVVWDADPAKFVINAMSPAKILAIDVDETKRSMNLAVEETSLSQAIGRGGQNVMLAAELTGWDLNILTEVEMAEQREAANNALKAKLMDALDITDAVAAALMAKGATDIEDVAFMQEADLAKIEGLDEATAKAVYEAANNHLLFSLMGDGDEEDDEEDGTDTDMDDATDAASDTSADDEGVAEPSTEVAADARADAIPENDAAK